MLSVILDLEQQGSNASESVPKPRKLSDQETGETPSRRSQIAWSCRRSLSPCGISPSWPGASPRDALMAEDARRTGCLAMASRHSGFCGASRFWTGRQYTPCFSSDATRTGKGGRPRVCLIGRVCGVIRCADIGAQRRRHRGVYRRLRNRCADLCFAVGWTERTSPFRTSQGQMALR